VVSDNSLPGCGSYGFQDVSPDQSRKFYDWFFAKGIAVGMKSFEPDFMNQNYNCVPEFIESAVNASIWQHGRCNRTLGHAWLPSRCSLNNRLICGQSLAT
jgi:hypothetical protein